LLPVFLLHWLWERRAGRSPSFRWLFGNEGGEEQKPFASSEPAALAAADPARELGEQILSAEAS
jgi:hypothetical protein